MDIHQLCDDDVLEIGFKYIISMIQPPNSDDFESTTQDQLLSYSDLIGKDSKTEKVLVKGVVKEIHQRIILTTPHIFLHETKEISLEDYLIRYYYFHPIKSCENHKFELSEFGMGLISNNFSTEFFPLKHIVIRRIVPSNKHIREHQMVG